MAAPKLTALKCPTCSAPLEVGPAQTDIRCHYCGSSIHIERQRPRARRQAAEVPPNTVYIDPSAGKMVGRIILLAVLLPIALPLIIGLVSVVSKASKGYFIRFPATCGINEELTISGKTFEGKGTLITTKTNCKLTIKNSTLKGDVVVKSESMSEIKIQNSKLEGATAALELASSTKVKITEGSEVKSPAIAITGASSVDVTVEDSKVEGSDAALKATSNAKLSATRAKILGKDAAIIVDHNGNFTLKESTVKADGSAISGTSNLKVTADATTITAGDEGIHSESSLGLKLGKKSALKATGIAIETTSNCDLQLDDSTIDSDDTAIHATSNCKVKISKGARVTGKAIGFDGTSNNQLVMQSGTLASSGTAFVGTSNIDIDAKKSTIGGGANAFLLSHKPSRLVLTDTQVTGAQVFDARDSQKPSPAALKRPTSSSSSTSPAAPIATRPAALPVAPKPAPVPRFDGAAAMAALDVAARSAATSCRSSTPGKKARVLIDPGFVPDGSNANASVRAPFKGTPEGLCVEAVFKRVKIAPFDPATLSSGMMRLVELN